MTYQPLTTDQVLDMIEERGWVPQIGQISGPVKRELDKLVKGGELSKYRGYWNTGLPFAGIGPLKTIYALPEVAAMVGQ